MLGVSGGRLGVPLVGGFLVSLALAGCVAAPHDAPASPPSQTWADPSKVPTWKPTDPRQQVWDDAIRAFMADRGIHAATSALSYRGTLQWTQGYGTMTRGGSALVPDDAMLRLASVTKPMTSAAVHLLAAQRKLSPDDWAFCTGQPSPPACHLTVEPPAGGIRDERLGQITIQHLLDHRGGWNASVSGDDPMFLSIEIARDLGIASPPGQRDIARWMADRPLDFAPGTSYAYSNFGYMLLGLIVEKVTGEDYTAWVKSQVYSDPLEGRLPGHVIPRDLELGRSLPALRNPREPAYNCDGRSMGETSQVSMGPNVFNPEEQVCWADGGWYLEAMEANGGLIASAETLTWFLDHYWISGVPRDPWIPGLPGVTEPPSPGGSFEYAFFGGLDGTFTIVRQLPDGIDYVALMNQRWDAAHGFYRHADLMAVLDVAAASWKPQTLAADADA